MSMNRADGKLPISSVASLTEFKKIVGQYIGNDDVLLSHTRLADIFGLLADHLDAVPPGAGLSAVSTDATIDGDGTPGDVLSLANSAVTAIKLATNAVETAKILDAAVTAAKLDTDSVTTDKIVNDAVTYSKLQDVSADRLLGRVSSNGTVQEIQLGTNLSFAGTTLNATGGGGGGGVSIGYQVTTENGNALISRYFGDTAPTMSRSGTTITFDIPDGTVPQLLQFNGSYANIGNSEELFIEVIDPNHSGVVYSDLDNLLLHTIHVVERDTFGTLPTGTGAGFNYEAGSMALASRATIDVYDVDTANNKIIYRIRSLGNGSKWSILLR